MLAWSGSPGFCDHNRIAQMKVRALSKTPLGGLPQLQARKHESIFALLSGNLTRRRPPRRRAATQRGRPT